MKRIISWLYCIVYCVLAGGVGAFIGAVAGVGIAGLLLRPEEAVVLTSGVFFGGPVGAITGLALGVFAMRRSNSHESTSDVVR